MVPLHRFTAVLDACTMFPMLVRDVLLTLAYHEFFTPRWSPRIREEWMRNLAKRLQIKGVYTDIDSRVGRIATAAAAAFPDAEVMKEIPETSVFDPIDPRTDTL